MSKFLDGLFETEKDMVNSPVHYVRDGLECIDAIEAATDGLSGFEGYCAGNAMKYLWRWKFKGGVQDLDKAIWYINALKKANERGL